MPTIRKYLTGIIGIIFIFVCCVMWPEFFNLYFIVSFLTALFVYSYFILTSEGETEREFLCDILTSFYIVHVWFISSYLSDSGYNDAMLVNYAISTALLVILYNAIGIKRENGEF